ncbi:unnamed protein product [Cylicocyclus nassatus]|uniref:Uncharacterized protein n=1 Tax=Cylicocyclus nassatus TaxID=53992 RepID=A0AA36DR98_CYLNA|nr:unnamed protein product [Cylicocyclus nassatus]
MQCATQTINYTTIHDDDKILKIYLQLAAVPESWNITDCLSLSSFSVLMMSEIPNDKYEASYDCELHRQALKDAAHLSKKMPKDQGVWENNEFAKNLLPDGKYSKRYVYVVQAQPIANAAKAAGKKLAKDVEATLTVSTLKMALWVST